jgi:adenylate cyclase
MLNEAVMPDHQAGDVEACASGSTEPLPLAVAWEPRLEIACDTQSLRFTLTKRRCPLGVQEDIKNSVDSLIAAEWSTRKGIVVPETTDVALANGAVIVDATYLFADLADSSTAAQKLKKEVTGTIFRAYLSAATRVIKRFGGEIRSFDGDRVMGIFIGDSKNTNAARAALGINWAVTQVVRPKLEARWTNLADYYTVHHGVGVDTGEAWIVRGGVRGANDLLSIGEAPNVAAKLSALRRGPTSYITDAVYGKLAQEAKIASQGDNMWSRSNSISVGGKTNGVYSSTWWKTP